MPDIGEPIHRSAGAVRQVPGPAPVAEFERARLAALARFRVFDTPPEETFDALTALAAQLCATPMASVTLVEADRMWFKSRLGLELSEIPREISFCAHALASPDVLMVPDTTADARFADNPLVTAGPEIRFYAGAPLVTADGYVLGTLCVLDVVPRVLSELQLSQLGVLASQVVSQLELRRHTEELAAEVAARTVAEAALRDNRRLLDGVLEHTDVVIFAKDLDGRFLLANVALLQLLGQGEQQVLGRNDYDLFPQLAADQFRQHDRQIAASGTSEQFAEALVHPDGTSHEYLSTKFPLRDDAGLVYAVAGVSTDVTALWAERRASEQSEQRWRALVESSPVAVAVIGGDGRFAYANPQAALLYGVPGPAELVGQPVRDFVPAGAERETAGLFGALLRGGPAMLGRRWELRRPDGSQPTVELNAAGISYLGLPAVQVELRDVSEQAVAEQALRDSEARFRALFTCSAVGIAESRPDGTLIEVNEQLCRLLGYPAEDLIGQPASMLLADQAQADRQHRDLAGLDTSSSYFAEREYRHRDGTVVPVIVGVGVVRDDAGRVTRVLGSVVDVSARVAAEHALREAHDELAGRQDFTEAVLDSIDVGIVACDAAGHLTVFNDATKAWHGIDLDEHPENAADPERFADAFDLRDAIGQLLTPDQVPLLRALHEGVVRDAEMVITPRGLPATRVLCSGRALTSPDGRPMGAVVAMTDITLARAQTLALQSSEQRFRTTFNNDPAGLAVLSPEGRPLQVNPALCRLLGRDEAALLALPDVLQLAVPEDRRALAALRRRALTERGASLTGERRLIRADGAELWTLLTVTELPDATEGSCILLQVEDITARRIAEKRLTRQALYDSLTDLPNRAMLLDRIKTALARLARRPGDGALAVMFCDLDGFKAVNDIHGHAAGDALLVEVARRLTHVMRPSDTVARFGGDEFVILCENLADPNEITRIAARVEAAISEPIGWLGQFLTVTASVGIAFGSGVRTAEELLRHADTAMYQAKQLGKDRYEVFDDDMRTRSTSRVRVERDLRTALDTGQVEVHYQPIFALPERRIVSVEALARLRLPDGSQLMPDAFIPVAEDTGLIVPLGTYVLRSACQQLSRWRSHLAPDLQVAVNLSARQAAQPELCDVVHAALTDAGLPAQALAVELTESVLLEAARSTLGKLGELRATGVDIGIDDFGTGYASLRYLRELPVTFLKVDRSFVAGMTEHTHDAVIVRTVMRLAADLGLGCVVEGVETTAQLEAISDSGAKAQGYLLGRPTTAERFTELLEQQQG